MIIYLFFFFCDLAHPDLHSFPTRRSSDLNASGSGGGFALSDAGGALQCHGATCAEAPAVIDLVGWGGAVTFSGEAPAPGTANGTSVERVAATGENGTDFEVGTPTPGKLLGDPG